jgi:hypothetical protein
MRSHIARALTATLALWLPLVAEAQTTATAPPAGTLTIERVEQGLVFAPDVRATELNGDTATLAGGHIGWMTDRTWLMGAGGYWLANQDDGPIGGRRGGIIDADTEILVREYFFVAEPQAGVVLHFARWAQLDLGVAYRFAAGAGRLDDELSGASASIPIQFGGTSREKP